MRHFLLVLAVLGLIAALVLRIRYGGGDDYPDLTAPPLLPESALEEVVSYPEPIGNVAVSPGGRLFFTVHPESRPQGNQLLEFIDGAATPYPSGAVQPHLFDTVLGLVVDDQNLLWTIMDSGPLACWPSISRLATSFMTTPSTTLSHREALSCRTCA